MQTNQVKNLWQQVLSKSREYLSENAVAKWIEPLKPVSLEKNVLTLATNDELQRQWVEDRYLSKLEEAFFNLSGEHLSIEIKTMRRKKNRQENEVQITLEIPEEKIPVEQNPVAEKKIAPIENSTLNKKYTFENFVIGKSNEFAHAAALAICKEPGMTYNPFFIYGGVGLGKTHLMHAICHHALSRSSSLKVQYLGTEKFLNDFVTAIASSKMREFREHYRSVDILLIDDIQFLGNKDQSQEEFYNTFNTLRDFQKQVVICSDRPPSELRGIEDRLISRFAWGLVADIKPPDFETRVAILQKKAMIRKYNLPNEIAGFLARHIPSNIRELEGALNRVIMSSELRKEPVDIEHVKLWLKDILKFDQPKISVSIEDIKSIVAEYFNISYESIDGSGRSSELALARQTAMYLCRNMTDINLRKIAQALLVAEG